MKEALKVITSAWSIAFIVVFFCFLGNHRSSADVDTAYLTDFFISFAGAITGAGWLVYRSQEKEGSDDK